jgi:hypothetical protein
MRGILLEPPAKNSDEQPKNSLWPSVVPPLAPFIVAAVAGVWYFILTISYDRFYETFGVGLDEVGLNYVNVLRSSVGSILLLSLFGSIVAWVYWSTSPTSRIRRKLRGGAATPALSAIRPLALLGFITIVTVFSGLVLPATADSRALDARYGERVTPPRIGPFILLSLNVSPAYVQSTAKSGENPAVEALQARRLFYIGQANSTIVLYDVLGQQAIRIPSSLVILKTDNCNRYSPCKRFLRYKVTCVNKGKRVGKSTGIKVLGGIFGYPNFSEPFRHEDQLAITTIEDRTFNYFIDLPGPAKAIEAIIVAGQGDEKYLTTATPQNESHLLSLPPCPSE